MNLFFYHTQLIFVSLLFLLQPALLAANSVRDKMNQNKYVANDNFSPGNETARKFGVHEVILKTNCDIANPLDIDCKVTSYAPSNRKIAVNAFCNGGKTWLARLYVCETGMRKGTDAVLYLKEVQK